MNDANVHTEWAFLLIDALARSGVHDVVISPGSRSTPLALAAVKHERLRAHSIIDERSAAFFALGQAKVTGAPSLLICTSGTAGAHYYPAVIEADRSFTPLVILTADRPPELHGNAAPQTTDQIRLYGTYARRYVELGLPDASREGLRALRRKAVQAVFDSRHPTPGAVHINAWFRKPLEPDERGAGGELASRLAELRDEPLPAAYAANPAPDEAGVEAVAEICRGVHRGLIVCGPAGIANARARSALLELAETLRFPVLAEGASQIRFDGIPHPLRCDGFDAFLRAPSFQGGHGPEAIVQFGAPPTSKAWERYLGVHPHCPRAVIAPHGWNDPQNSASIVLQASAEEAAAAIREALGGAALARPSRWTEAFAAAEGVTWRLVEESVHEDPTTLGKGALARTVVASLPEGSILAVANSLAIREIDSYCPGSLKDTLVWHQKGVNGIDGLISGAAGAASVHIGPVTLFLGDVAFLHDLHGLAAVKNAGGPFVIVVAQNDGGRIFEQLPIAESPAASGGLLDYWTTPHGLDFSHAAKLFGHEHRKARNVAELRDALAEAHRARGCTIVEAELPPSAAAGEHRLLLAAVESALGRGGEALP